MDSRALADAIRARARELGFARTGFCAATLPEQAAVYERWLDAGMHGEMIWMETTRDRRLDPRRLLPGVQSIVALAFPYARPGSPRPAAPPGSGRLARYAEGTDYHVEVGGRLEKLAAFIEERVEGARALTCVDAAPVLERLWAAQAGVGWIGRHALVLDKVLGSWTFLGVILTTADLPPDTPAADQCGSCTLCVDACPTGAIVEGRMVDSRRCLSYHTIELRGAIPEPAREALGAQVFGCDECQEVCPWNAEAGPQSAGASSWSFPKSGKLHSSSEPRVYPLIDLLMMSHAEYLQIFGNSAVRRASWRSMRRNAAVALGNTLRDRRATELPVETRALHRVAGDLREDPVVRDAARWALRQVRTP
jgi:epoxyqueuosine reductase